MAGVIRIVLAPITFLPYVLVTLTLGAKATRLPRSEWWRIPVAFAAHHLTYLSGILWGMLRGTLRR